MTIKPNSFNHVIVCFLLIAALLGLFPTMTGCATQEQTQTETEANPPKTAYIGRNNSPQYVECGTCGAHVLEWWKVRNDTNTAWVNVCILCAQKIDEETK